MGQGAANAASALADATKGSTAEPFARGLSAPGLQLPAATLAALRPGRVVVCMDGARRARRGVLLALVAPGDDPARYLPQAPSPASRCRFRVSSKARRVYHCLVEVSRPDNAHDGRPLPSLFFLPSAAHVSAVGSDSGQAR